jgi:3-methyladenine DNA glycosylase/8-oxoguanine DNA glycosylase
MTVYARREPSPDVVASIAEEIRWRFDLDSTGAPEFIRRFRRDPYVGPPIRRRPGMRMANSLSLYEYLVITVLLQNTVVRRSVSMLQALYERFGQRIEFDGQRLWAFWDPEAIQETSEDDLRALKVGYRARTLKRQAEQFVAGEIDEAKLRNLRDWRTVAEALDRIYGVGPQSATYMLSDLFHVYGPTSDHISPWEGKIMGRLLFGRATGSGRVAKFVAGRYGEFAGLAFHYIFVDAFWRHRVRPIPWLSREIRL